MSHQQEIRLNIIVALYWLAQYSFIPRQSIYLTGIGVSAFWVGLIVGAYGLTQLVLRVPVGVLAAAYYYRKNPDYTHMNSDLGL